MSANAVNHLNSGLMLASCAAALWLPFELFLLVYAVLGPLHYLTQISWLHSRGYFTTGRYDFLILVALTAAYAVVNFVPLGLRNPNAWGTGLIALAVGVAFAAAFVTAPAAKLAAIILALLLATAVSDWSAAQVVLVLFVPAIVHVYVFTAAFILHGALKSRSASAALSLVVFVACTVILFLLPTAPDPAAVGESVRQRYQTFVAVNLHLSAWLPVTQLRSVAEVYGSHTGVLLMRLIAFSYTYHYLNWFSKTSVIQWHRIPRSWAIANIALWVAALGLYWWDYERGIAILFTLSLLHVFLEFPLDQRTLAGIGRELGALAFSGRRS
jgi:hypothetical protein